MMNIIQQVTDPMPTNLSYIDSAKLLLLSSLLRYKIIVITVTITVATITIIKAIKLLCY